ncbi:DUF6461 domain-containing protein [Kitasatospora sp. NBC_00458]|uniref:DUF6461 domain-containing protein n=1 Tax=Kitasatospora sp. NBC_00458 TaxID=2903568 RepID=UPI002E16D73D
MTSTPASSATAADYGWIRSAPSLFGHLLSTGYSMVLVRDVLPEQVPGLVGASPWGSCRGAGELVDAHGDFLEECDDDPESTLLGASAVRDAEGRDWALVVDLGGDLGLRPGPMAALSAGTRAVAHYSNAGKPMDFFHWYEDGELRTAFEHPAHRDGTTPDELNGVLRELGLDPDGDGDPALDRKAAVLALTERLTGVRVTVELLEAAEYLASELPEEPVDGSDGVRIHLVDEHGAPVVIESTWDR